MTGKKKDAEEEFVGQWGVDSRGYPLTDPSKNVLALVEAAILRVDDLLAERSKRFDGEIGHLKELVALRAVHARDIREIETKRLDAIRQVDVMNANTTADRSQVAIQTLATQTAANAETLRALVATTATTIAAQTTATVQAITERISALEKSSYEGKGKGSGVGMSAAVVAQIITSLIMVASLAVVLFKH